MPPVFPLDQVYGDGEYQVGQQGHASVPSIGWTRPGALSGGVGFMIRTAAPGHTRPTGYSVSDDSQMSVMFGH